MHLPANTWNARHESRGEDAGASSTGGTTITASGTANTKGSWTALGSATGFTYEGIIVHIAQPSATGDWVVDIGIDDGAGNNFVLVADLRFPGLKHAEGSLHYTVPVHVPSGSLLEARVASTVASGTIQVTVTGSSANLGGYPGYSRAIALNTFSSSRGVAVDAGATADDKGAWAEITSSTPVDLAGLFYAVGHNGDVVRGGATALLDIGLGAAASEHPIFKDALMCWNTSYDGPHMIIQQPFPAQIPAGSRVAARMSSSTATAGDRTVDLTVYGLVP